MQPLVKDNFAQSLLNPGERNKGYLKGGTGYLYRWGGVPW